MHPLKQYLTDLRESVADFGARVGASRQTLYRIINERRAPKPALARRIVEATGGAVSMDDLFGAKANGAQIIAMNNDGEELDAHRLRVAMTIVFNHLSGKSVPDIDADQVEIAAEAVANTYAALSSVTTRRGPARLTQALRPVLEEILQECADPAPSADTLDRGAELATQLYFHEWGVDER